jgi:hypothetical protein
MLNPLCVSMLIPRSLFTSGTMIGFDASGHVAEETRNARQAQSRPACPNLTLIPNCSVIAARGILSSALATGVMGFLTSILFLFCTPDLGTLFSLDAPQPFVQIYAMALGKGPSIFMTIIAVLGLILVSPFPWPYRSAIDTILPVPRVLASRSSLPPDSFLPWPVTASCPSPPGSAKSTVASSRETP